MTTLRHIRPVDRGPAPARPGLAVLMAVVVAVMVYGAGQLLFAAIRRMTW